MKKEISCARHNIPQGTPTPIEVHKENNKTSYDLFDYKSDTIGQDFDLVNRLLRNPRYNIPEQLRGKAIHAINKILDSEEATDRTTISAIKALTQMDKINVDLVKIAMPRKVEHHDVKNLNDEELKKLVQETMKRLPPVLE